MLYELVLNDHWPFKAGEILVVVDEYEREALGDQRKSAKWDVKTLWFTEPADAVAEALRRGLTPCAPDAYPDSETAKAVIRLNDVLAS